MPRYRFKFFDGQVFVADGETVRDALDVLGLSAYNPVAYEVKELPLEQQESQPC